ncbi:MAG TPA: BTAD domain-containing putative transcriptional regulator [Anaerolineaceae bacterium]|jgi:LuxR family transcriptional regulator, maltose regulon positive regulatory protein
MVYQKSPLVRTKLMPPRLHRRILIRPRLTSLLLGALDYRLTILQAGAGYGKTTALAALKECGYAFAWYHLGHEDTDPFVFLFHLVQAIKACIPNLPAAGAAAFLESEELNSQDLPWPGIVDSFTNDLAEHVHAPVLVVLDDVHTLNDATVVQSILERLVERSPADLHFLFSSRYPLRLPALATWRAQGELLFIGQDELAFTMDEVASLFREHYALSISDEDIRNLAAETEGWAIALQLYWQGLKSGAVTTAERLPGRLAVTAEGLFDYLAREVFEQLSPDVRQFLRTTAILRELNAPVCNLLRGETDSDQYLRYLYENGMFLAELGGDSIRYHHLFREFILRQLPEADRRELDCKAAAIYLTRKQEEEAIYHYLKADAYSEAAVVMADIGEALLRAGRMETLNKWISGLPPAVLDSSPQLMVFLGDIARLHSRFEESLGWYRHAEDRFRIRGDMGGLSRSLHGRARIYLDTVNPAEAELVLQEALRVADGQSDRENRAHLLELLAENRLNSGHLDEAEHYRVQARELREFGTNESELSIRVLLRTGRIARARQALEERAAAERQSPVSLPRSHRETLLLLSLICSFEGEAEIALRTAREGTLRGNELHSPFVIGVGHMRQGHALTLLNTPDAYDQARQQFEKAVEISQTLEVSRLRVEACWGLCRVYGYLGDLSQALRAAEEGYHLATQAGDGWMGSLVCKAMGASYILAGQFELAEEWLSRAAAGMEAFSDPFARSVARLWLCLGWLRQKKTILLAATLPEVMSTCRQNGYDFLFTRPTLLGPPDERMLVPLLIYARDHNWDPSYASRLLAAQGLPEIALHPGYRLRIYTLGSFQVWTGSKPVLATGWRREKARQLFQVLLSNRTSALDRDQILELLWPGLDPATAQRNFKVTLNALYQVLEPERDAGQESAYIMRDGTVYSLRSGADLWLDAEAFTDAVRQGEALLEKTPETGMALLKEALAQYKGEYLPEERYETFAAAERERLAVLFLHSADRLSEAYIKFKKPSEAVELCQRILAIDDCWERAYGHLMKAYSLLGNHGMLARTYQHCVQTLRKELDVSPAPETEALYQQLLLG